MKTLATVAIALMMMPLTVSAAKAKKKQIVKKVSAIEVVGKECHASRRSRWSP